MDTGLFLLRKIDPPADLMKILGVMNQVYEFEDGSVYVDDDVVRDAGINQQITGWEDARKQWVTGCTVGWGIFDQDLRQHAFYRDLQRAQTALSRAVPKVITEVELEQEEAVDEQPGAVVTVGIAPTPPKVETIGTTMERRKKPFEA